MNDQFQHVMVLASIIIGLGITYILVGAGSAIERITGHGARLRLSWAHAVWLLNLFVWMVTFWWWESRLLALLKGWTLGHYFFIIIYAVLLFLLAVLLLPRDWATTDSLDDYFLSKRKWFYPLYLIAIFADIVDAWLKGAGHISKLTVFRYSYTGRRQYQCAPSVFGPKAFASTRLWRSSYSFCS